ncbi:type ISP restriction/modification enzyme [Helicobacter cetorum]|uniref:type ISP restriction/modification enzyme n=1 Tax=Helicobacter cetorum TaxID=138563 RepID=UPI000CF0711E|nr:type ISP restriction/modification enzyme [Helicobacter cetorum]
MLKTYLQDIKGISNNTNELTYRHGLHKLLEELIRNFNSKYQLEHEPPRDTQGRGAPDFRIYYKGLNVGYVENKRLGTNLNSLVNGEQVAKYLELSPNLILTDYLNFIWVKKDEKNNPYIVRELQVASKEELALSKPNRQKEQNLVALFNDFLQEEVSKITTAKDFATHLSTRTRYLKDSLMLNEENPDIKTIFENFREYLCRELSFNDFCDCFAQTLTYSLFLAKLNNSEEKAKEEISLDNVKRLIPKNFSLIREMALFLGNLNEIREIKWLLEEIITLINHIDMSSIIRDLNNHKNNESKDPYLHFYETFLSAYDPKLRETKGVYYTPSSVVKFIINALDSLLKTHFKNAPKGLVSALDNENITLLDFATGTGTFLLEAFKKALDIPKKEKNSPKYKPKNLLKQFFGFEYLIAPYVIAHLKMSQAFKEEFDISLNEEDRFSIYLTNTLLQPSEVIGNRGLSPALEKELENSQKIKMSEKILIITGNPPYSGASANKNLFELDIKATYGLEPKNQFIETKKNVKLTDEIKKLLANIQKQKESNDKESLKKLKDLIKKYKLENEKNPKWLLDDYVKFMRFAQNKIENLGYGLFGFISNNAFLDNPTFRGLRFSLLECYDEIYILNLHGNTRKKELTPQGTKDENVFDIMQGVSINLFVKNPNTEKKVFYYDCYGKREEKYAFLTQNDLNSMPWIELKPTEPFYLLMPQDNALLEEYQKGWGIKDMFQVGGVGICSKRDHVVFHKDKESLLQLLKDFSTLEPSELRKIYDIGDDSRDWRLNNAIKEVRNNIKCLEEHVVLCQYRPFDYRWTYYTPNSRAFLAYPVYDVFKHMLPPTTNSKPSKTPKTRKNIALSVARQSKMHGEWHYAMTSQTLTDLSMMGGGNTGAGYNYPLYQCNNPSYIENFTHAFREFIDKHYAHHFEPLEILGYIYALLYSPHYRKRYEDFLKTDFPKILFTTNKDLFEAMSLLGIELLGLHVLNDESLKYSFNQLKDSNIGYPYYKESDKFFDNTNKNPIIEKPFYNEIEQRLYINKSAYFESVSSGIWNYQIGGYQVLDKYLKSHKNEECDFSHMETIIKVLARTIEIQNLLEILTSDLPSLKGVNCENLIKEILHNKLQYT